MLSWLIMISIHRIYPYLSWYQWFFSIGFWCQFTRSDFEDSEDSEDSDLWSWLRKARLLHTPTSVQDSSMSRLVELASFFSLVFILLSSCCETNAPKKSTIFKQRCEHMWVMMKLSRWHWLILSCTVWTVQQLRET